MVARKYRGMMDYEATKASEIFENIDIAEVGESGTSITRVRGPLYNPNMTILLRRNECLHPRARKL